MAESEDETKQQEHPKLQQHAAKVTEDVINHSDKGNNYHTHIVTQPTVQLSPYLETEEDARIAAELVKKGPKHHKKWNRRMKVFFCCLGYQKNKDSIADIASIFAEYFADLNIPTSDIGAGFVLLSKYQAAQREWIVKNHNKGVEQFLSSIPIKEDTKFLDTSSPDDSYLINDLIYYMNYSLAIFGWPLHMMEHPCTVCCIYPHLRLSLCSSGKRTSSSKKSKSSGEKDDKSVEDGKITQAKSSDNSAENSSNSSQTNSVDKNNLGVFQATNQVPGKLDEINNVPIVLEDNCCSCNSVSAERRLASHNYEIIYLTFRAAVGVVPFLVAADHSKRTIVVAIRGSMGLSDMITDMNGLPDKLPIDDCPDDWLCHRGITKVASYVKHTLIQEHVLHRAFNCRPDLGSQEYQLLLCGHSLGAGAAAILGVLLYKQYPNLKAYLYSPPGGMLSLPVVEFTKKFATGVILGNDTVPRLGMAQLERLRYQVLLSINTSDTSTGKIIAKAIGPKFLFGKNKVDYDPNQSIDLLFGSRGRSFDYNSAKIPFQVQNKILYVPGRLIHVVRNYSFKTKTRPLANKPIYQAVWTDNELYDRVIIDKGMFLDHLPQNLHHAMKMLFLKTLPRRESVSPTKFEQVNPVPYGLGVNHHNDQQIDTQQDPDSKQVSGQLAQGPSRENINDEINNNNSDDSVDMNKFDNNNDYQEYKNKMYPKLGSGSTEQIYQFDANIDLGDHVKSGDMKIICDDIDENGNEKTSS